MILFMAQNVREVTLKAILFHLSIMRGLKVNTLFQEMTFDVSISNGLSNVFQHLQRLFYKTKELQLQLLLDEKSWDVFDIMQLTWNIIPRKIFSMIAPKIQQEAQQCCDIFRRRWGRNDCKMKWLKISR